MVNVSASLVAFSVAECFAFLICTKWHNPAIHRRSHIRSASSSSTIVGHLNWNSGFVVSSDEDYQQSRLCSLQDIGGHVMKVPLIGFQILLFMRLEVYLSRYCSRYINTS